MDIANAFDIVGMEFGTDPSQHARTALKLDSSLAGQGIHDITYAEAGVWVVEEISALNLGDADAIRSRIAVALETISDNKACALWPISAHAHMQVIHQLEHLLIDTDMPADDGQADMAFSMAAKWAEAEVMAVDLEDPHSIADRIAVSARKLEDKENCRQWPGSAYAHRKVVADLTVFLKRTRGTVH